MTCKGVIPDTFIACGEGGNFCSSECHFDDLVRRARELPPMTEEQVKEQRASFAYGNLALMREYQDASPETLADLRARCRRTVPARGASRGEVCRGETHGVREDAARAWIPPREEADDEPEADRRSRERWHAAALCLGFNELAKLGRTLGEKVYHRMMRAGAEEHFIALGGQRIFQEEPTLVTLTLEDGMPWVRFRACDIELMREAVAKWDADHIDDTTGGDDA